MGVLSGPRLEARVNDESGQFSGYFLKVTNPDNAVYDLWIDGFQENVDENGWLSLAGRTQSPLSIELVGNGQHPIATMHTVHFDVNGGSNVDSQDIAEGDRAIRPQNPTKDGFDFDYWYLDPECTQPFDFDTPITENITLYAHWIDNEPEPTFTITFDFNGGTRDGARNYEIQTVAFAPDISEELCMNIDGVKIQAPAGKQLDAIEVNGVRTELGSSFIINSDITLKYLWKDIPHVHNGGTTTTVIKATLSKDGHINKSTKCTICGKVFVNTTVIYYPKTINLSKTEFTYNKKVQKPSITVIGSDGKTIAPSNYTITFSNNNSKKVGEYKVYITFKGNYEGTKTLTYKIVPKGTKLSKLTAGKKQITATWKAQKTETTGYQIEYSTNKKFNSGNKKVTIKKNKTISTTIKKLKGKKKYYVRIRTYKTVNGTKIYSSWSNSKNIKTKK